MKLSSLNIENFMEIVDNIHILNDLILIKSIFLLILNY